MTDPPAERAESTWTRLRRRTVVQWGIAYAAAAWLLMQVLEYFSGTFDWPREYQQLSTLALLIGLPIVVVLAWYHGDRGQQRISRPELAWLIALVLLGGGALWFYGDRDAPAETSTAGTATETLAPSPTSMTDKRPSIAVLPFDNRSRLEDDVYFVDGIHDDILTQLSKISALKVISRTSVERFRGSDEPIKLIAEQLGVSCVLIGGVQRVGGRVRINLQLIDAATDTHLWADSYDRELTTTEIFAIQSEVATEVAGSMKATLMGKDGVGATSVPTRSLEAWEAYQLGRRRIVTRTSAGLVEAEKFFRRAIELDQGFALAWVGLADTLELQMDYSGAPLDSWLAEAEAAIDRALEIDPGLGEAWATSAALAARQEQHDTADARFRRAIELAPNYAQARHWYSYFLVGVGRRDEAAFQARKAVEIDPLSAPINTMLAMALASDGDFDGAKSAFERAISIDPLAWGPYHVLSLIEAYAHNDFVAAVTLSRQAGHLNPDGTAPSVWLANLCLDLADDACYVAAVERAAARWPELTWIHSQLARVSLLRNEVDAAARHAGRALELNPRNGAALAYLCDLDLRRGRPLAAVARYRLAYPNLFASAVPEIDGSNFPIVIRVAHLVRQSGDDMRASMLLDLVAKAIEGIPRLGTGGSGITDVQLLALRDRPVDALTALRRAEQAGWRGPDWRYDRDHDPILTSIRNEPEFKAVFAGIERDMAQQRARLAERPKDAPLELSSN